MAKISKKETLDYRNILRAKHIRFALNHYLRLDGSYTTIDLLQDITHYLNSEGVTFEEAYQIAIKKSMGKEQIILLKLNGFGEKRNK